MLLTGTRAEMNFVNCFCKCSFFQFAVTVVRHYHYYILLLLLLLLLPLLLPLIFRPANETLRHVNQFLYVIAFKFLV